MYQMTFSGVSIIETMKSVSRWMVDNENEAALIVAVTVTRDDNGWYVTLDLEK